MARSDLSPARRGLAKAAARARLAGTIITAAALLVVPIILWATFGDGELQHAVAVAIIATLLCWCFMHRLDTHHETTATPERATRRQLPAEVRRLDHLRAAGMARPARHVGCPTGPREGQAARRRHPF